MHLAVFFIMNSTKILPGIRSSKENIVILKSYVKTGKFKKSYKGKDVKYDNVSSKESKRLVHLDDDNKKSFAYQSRKLNVKSIKY
jgi:hypothetical protein